MKDFEGIKRDFGSSQLSGGYEVTLRMPDAGNSAFYDSDESIVTIPRQVIRFVRHETPLMS